MQKMGCRTLISAPLRPHLAVLSNGYERKAQLHLLSERLAAKMAQPHLLSERLAQKKLRLRLLKAHAAAKRFSCTSF